MVSGLAMRCRFDGLKVLSLSKDSEYASASRAVLYDDFQPYKIQQPKYDEPIH